MPSDEYFMRQALQLAAKGEGLVEPNPMVGCVLVKDGQIIGRGFHEKFGGPHAEVAALRSLPDSQSALGATAYVTLEPCCHHGKTPPCTQSLIRAGVGRVVVATKDPFPQVDGGGLRLLRESGIEVATGVLQDEAEQRIAPFSKLVQHSRPWVIAKWAMTIDGKIATASGQSQWITGQAARSEVHRLRSRVDAIAVGMGTVIADNPMLDARKAAIGDLSADEQFPRRVAARVIFCGQTLPGIDSKLIQTSQSIPTWIFADAESIDNKEKHRSESIGRLRDLGAEIWTLPGHNPPERVREVLNVLGKKQLTNVMIEGGARLLSSFFEAGEVDETHVYIGAKAFGSAAAPGPIGGSGVKELSQAWQFKPVAQDQFGDDFRIIYRRK